MHILCIFLHIFNYVHFFCIFLHIFNCIFLHLCLIAYICILIHLIYTVHISAYNASLLHISCIFMHTLYCIFLHICSVHHQAYIFCRDTRYIRDAQVIAHELTYHHLHPSPLPGSESQDAPGYSADSPRMLCGKVPVSPTGTKGSFPRTCVMGRTYST